MRASQASKGVWVRVKRNKKDDLWSDYLNEYEGTESVIIRAKKDADGVFCHLMCGNEFGIDIRSLILISQDVSKIKIGSKVILRSHDWVTDIWTDNRGWHPDMEKLVGKQAIVLYV
jgi:hypothetical protein